MKELAKLNEDIAFMFTKARRFSGLTMEQACEITGIPSTEAYRIREIDPYSFRLEEIAALHANMNITGQHYIERAIEKIFCQQR